MNLTDLGWQPFFDESFEPYRQEGLAAARVAREEKSFYLVQGEGGEFKAEVTGKLRHEAASRADLPAVGDWVVIEPRPGEKVATIHALLPRRSSLSRKQAGAKTEVQIVAANVDTVFLVSGLDGGRNFNLPRIERYLTFAYESAVNPVIVLNKADVCDDVDGRIADVEGIAFDVPVHAVSALKKDGIDELREYLVVGETVAFLGPSGVGKSTLINALSGEDTLAVGGVRQGDYQGRHTTTWRELILLPGGGLVIDNPGMRELQLWGDEETLGSSFQDIDELAQGCRYGDCRHESEPGCAVNAAVEEGTFDASRLESYHKQEKELRFLKEKQSARKKRNAKARWKPIAKLSRDFMKDSPKHREE